MEAKTELQKNAIADARRKELETYQRALDIQWLNSRMEDGRMGRCLALIQREADMEKGFQERTDHAAIVNARAEKEIALGTEIAKVGHNEACELLRRHYLREHDPGLRQLIKKLQAGYVCRDLQQQILHNQYKKLQDKVEEDRSNRVLLDSLYNDQEAMEREEKEKMEHNREYSKDIQQQLVSRQRERQCRYEDTLVEKKMLEDVMRTIADEDQRELQHKREQTEKMRNEMITFKKAREAWKEKQKELVVIEERQIEEQRKMAADRSSAIVAERERRLKAKEENNDKIVAKILADQAAILERENIIKMLQEQECLERNVQDDIAARNKLETVRRDTKESLTSQMRSRQAAAREGREMEAVFRQEIEAKMASDDQKAEKKEATRREKNLQYSRDLRRQMEDNARRRRADRRLEDRRGAAVRDAQDAWNSEVQEERKKIIEEHVPNVMGYLQAGVLRPQDVCGHLPGALPTGGSGGPGGGAPGASVSPVNKHPKCNAQCRILREY